MITFKSADDNNRLSYSYFIAFSSKGCSLSNKFWMNY